jgi:hypothetical protein
MRGFRWQALRACTEDIELEKEIKNSKSGLRRYIIRRRALRTVMNENHDPLIHKFPPEIASHIFIQYAPPSALFDKDIGVPRYISVRCARNGDSWPGQHHSFGPRSSLDPHPAI